MWKNSKELLKEGVWLGWFEGKGREIRIRLFFSFLSEGILEDVKAVKARQWAAIERVISTNGKFESIKIRRELCDETQRKKGRVESSRYLCISKGNYGKAWGQGKEAETSINGKRLLVIKNAPFLIEIRQNRRCSRFAYFARLARLHSASLGFARLYSSRTGVGRPACCRVGPGLSDLPVFVLPPHTMSCNKVWVCGHYFQVGGCWY